MSREVHVRFCENVEGRLLCVTRLKQNLRELVEPGEMKLPKTANIDDVTFVIEKLLEGMPINRISLEIVKRFCKFEDINRTDTNKQKEKTERRMNNMAEVKYEIIEKIVVLSEASGGWTKELNLVSWNDKPAKYDIRDWAPEHEKMGKGVTLSQEEMEELKKAIQKL